MPELSLSRLQILAILVAAAALLFVAGRFVLHLGGGRAAAVPFRPVVAPAPRAALRRLVVVDVVGAVRHAGLLRLPQGARVADAVARAGGATSRADLALVNLAAPIADGQQVVVPARGSPASAAPEGSAVPGGPAGPVSLSTATEAQLDGLPGIGPVTAQKILAYRQQHGAFRSVAELDAIPGIGPARIEQLKGLVVP
jgi:competence protein ComEA